MPEDKPLKVVVVPLPLIPPGFIVQLPVGRPLKATLPVGVVQSGWVIVPTTGVEGVAGAVLITTFAVALLTQPSEFVTV